MAVPFETIKPEVDRLRNFIIGDLDYLVRQETGGNYLAAVLITCACDALSHLKHGKENQGELFFAEVIPSEWKPLSRALYRAIRNGIVHLYDTQFIRVNSRKMELVISWRMKPHFHRSADGKQIFINIQTLAADFKAAVKCFETDLIANPQLREIFERSMRTSREISVEKRERAAWEHSLQTMKVAT